MRSLTKTGRKWICRKLGMIDKNESIFVKNRDAFCDRMELLNILYDVDKIIEIYKEEQKSFKSEREYNKFLETGLDKVKQDVETKVKTSSALVEAFSSIDYNINIDYFKTEKEFDTEINKDTFLRIYFDKPMFEGFKYLCDGLYEIAENSYDYIFNITHSEFLSYNTDLNIFSLSDDIIKIIDNNRLYIGASIFSIISPKFLNKKEVKTIGKSEVEFISSENKPVVHIDNLINYIRNNDILSFKNANVEIYKIESLAHNYEISRKIDILQRTNGTSIKLLNYSPYTLIAYLRKISKKPESKYDRYIEMDNNILKMEYTNEINWIN